MDESLAQLIPFPQLLACDKFSLPKSRNENLGHKLSFTYYPSSNRLQYYENLCRSPRPSNEIAVTLFIGQVPFGLPASIVAWAIDLLAAKYCVRWAASGKKNGCAKICVERDSKLEDFLIEKMNGSLVFDLSGVWHVQPGAQELYTDNYCVQYYQKLHLQKYDAECRDRTTSFDPRLPRQSIVIEQEGVPRARNQHHPTLVVRPENVPVVSAEDDDN